MSYRIIEDGHISSPQGYRATGISCGLKEVKARDLALISSTRPSSRTPTASSSAPPAATKTST